jgi:methylmalonyl-CoA/ethylmalonyl-CoA epimerase
VAAVTRVLSRDFLGVRERRLWHSRGGDGIRASHGGPAFWAFGGAAGRALNRRGRLLLSLSPPQQIRPQEQFMATRLRHIAIIVPDPEAAAKFFENAFDMKRAGTARRGIYMSDGVMNVALLKRENDEEVGLYHFGMWVDDLDSAEKKVLDAGGSYLEGRPTSPKSYYEAKYKDPLGIVFDLTHTGWVGAAKDVVAKA